MLTLYGFPASGNTHKVRLALGLLGLDHEEITLRGGAHKQPDYLLLNPFGLVPVLRDGPVIIRDSQAILVYLAARYRPGDWDGRLPAEKAHIAQWLSLAANEIAHGPNRLRLNALFGAPVDRDEALRLTIRLLEVFETRLRTEPFLVGGRLTIADLACAPYLALRHQAGMDLPSAPAVDRWTQAIARLPGFVPLSGWPAQSHP